MESRRVFLNCPHCDKKTTYTFSFEKKNSHILIRYNIICSFCSGHFSIDVSKRTGSVVWIGIPEEHV